MTTPASVHDLAVRYTAAWCSHDPDQVASCYAESGSLAVNQGPPAIGRAAIADVARGFFSDFSNLILRMDGLRVAGDRAVYLWTLEGTNDGPGGSGHEVRLPGYEVWRLGDDGSIAESLGHFDAEEYARQLAHGVDPAREWAS